jgi:hypothetical protein
MGLLAKKKEIGPDTIIQRRNDLLFNEIDGEVVMLSVENGEYYGMDRVGSYIWKLLETPISLLGLVNTLTKKYEVSEERCLEEIRSFIEELETNKLIYFR